MDGCCDCSGFGLISIGGYGPLGWDSLYACSKALAVASPSFCPMGFGSDDNTESDSLLHENVVLKWAWLAAATPIFSLLSCNPARRQESGGSF